MPSINNCWHSAIKQGLLTRGNNNRKQNIGEPALCTAYTVCQSTLAAS